MTKHYNGHYGAGRRTTNSEVVGLLLSAGQVVRHAHACDRIHQYHQETGKAIGTLGMAAKLIRAGACAGKTLKDAITEHIFDGDFPSLPPRENLQNVASQGYLAFAYRGS